MVSLDVKFSCEQCGLFVVRQVRVGSQFFLGGDNLPDGWRVEAGEGHILTWCPYHSCHVPIPR